MRNFTNMNKRYHTNQRLLNNNNNSIHYLEPNNIRNLKVQSNIRRNHNQNRKDLIHLNTNNQSQKFSNINLRNLQKTIIDECEDSLANKKKGDYNPNRPNRDFYHKKNYLTKDLTNYSSSIYDNPYLNLTNTSSTGHKNYKKYKEKLNIHRDRSKNDSSYDYIIGEYNNLYNANSKGKSNNRNVSSTSYDFKKISLKKPNSRGERKIPIIVVTKKSNKNFNKTSSTMNFYKRKENIIKIQSVWRGYFLRKIAVGSIKKYIGFIALIKYMEKIFSNNIEYLFYEFIFLLRKYPNLKTVYKKINNKKNKLKNTRKRNKTQFDDNMVDVTDDNNNNYRINELKTNLFQSEDFNNYKLTKDISVDNANYPKERYQKYTPNKLRKIGDNISAYTHNERQKDKSISRYDSMYKNEINSQNHYFLYRKKLNNYSELSNDVINSPQNIVYIPKKVCGNKGFRNKNLIKENENKKKIENFIKIIKYYCYYKYYPYILYKLKILQKLKIITHKLNTLYNVIELIEKKKLKQYLKNIEILFLQSKLMKIFLKNKEFFQQ